MPENNIQRRYNLPALKTHIIASINELQTIILCVDRIWYQLFYFLFTFLFEKPMIIIPTIKVRTPVATQNWDPPVIISQFEKHKMGAMWTMSAPCRNHNKPRKDRIIPRNILTNFFIFFPYANVFDWRSICNFQSWQCCTNSLRIEDICLIVGIQNIIDTKLWGVLACFYLNWRFIGYVTSSNIISVLILGIDTRLFKW